MKKSRLIWIMLSLLGLAFTFTKIFPPVGFCASEFRFPTDEEYMIQSLFVPFGRGEIKLDKMDTSPLAYYRHHPDCCIVYRKARAGNAYNDILMYLLNTDALDVGVSFTLKQTVLEPINGEFIAVEYEESISTTVDGCGRTLEHSSTTDRKYQNSNY